MIGSKQAGSTTTVDRVASPSPQEFFKNFVSRGKPAVLTGAMENWLGLTEWTPDGLRDKVGDKKIKVNRRPDGVYRKIDQVQMSLAEYLDILEDPDRRELYYINGLSLNEQLAELVGDFTAPQCLKPKWAENLHFWLGYASRTINHFHSHDEAPLCQVIGQKRVILYPPGDTWTMYPKRFFDDDHNCSYVDPHDPDLEKYPKFKYATPIECVLDPGEMLFIPIYWWHGVYGLEFSASGTFFWGALLRQYHFPVPAIRCGVQMTLNSFRGLRHLVPESWRNT